MTVFGIKLINKYVVTLVLTGLLGACASGPPSYEQNIRSAVSGRGNITITHLDNGVVLLGGWVGDIVSRNNVYRAALAEGHEGKVIIRIDVSD